MNKIFRLWATTDKKTYEQLLLHIARSVGKEGKKMKIGEFVEQAVKEKLEQEKSDW